jgi:hypothetical protein
MVPHQYIHMAFKGGSNSSAAMLARLLPLLLLLAAAAAASNASYDGAAGQPPISRRSFPEGFIFGTASSAYQVVTVFLISLSCTRVRSIRFRVKGPAAGPYA